MSEMQNPNGGRTPTVYFIDDSATMREVIKIAFRKENIQIITCPDAATALAQFLEVPPDAVITDVIMPDKDGYEVCQFIKQHERFGNTPVILMSGVVNRTVAERAMEVKADELIRKPFQPQDLLMRVKNLLYPKSAVVYAAADYAGDRAQTAPNAMSPALAGLFSSGPVPATQRPNGSLQAVASAPPAPAPAVPAVRRAVVPSAEVQKLKNEMRRLELLVKKLQAELEAEHQYCAALEAHFKTLQDSE
jgi:DNA-binding response OmpR family regulator